MTFTNTTKSEIFKAAWGMARAYAAQEGTGAKAQFARALREAHASAKQADEWKREEAAAAERRAEADIEEMQEAMSVLGKFGPPASAAKDAVLATAAGLRARLAA